MKQQFFTVLSASLILLHTASCRKQDRQAPDYDSRRVTLLVQACDAAAEQNAAAAQKLFEAMAREFPEESFLAIAKRNEQKRHLILMANELLVATQFNKLAELVRDTERMGITCPELMEFTRITNALNALRLFVQKMPWQTAGFLRQNLRQLDAFSDILNKSTQYVDFRYEQEQTLAKLTGQEHAHAFQAAVNAMDLALITGRKTPEARADIAKLSKKHDQHLWEICSSALENGDLADILAKAQNSRDVRKTLEIAAMDKWTQIPDTARQLLLMALAQHNPESLCGKYLAAQSPNANAAINSFVDALAQHPEHPVPSKKIVRDIFQKLNLRQNQRQNWQWASPCPGAPDIIASIKQLGLN